MLFLLHALKDFLVKERTLGRHFLVKERPLGRNFLVKERPLGRSKRGLKMPSMHDEEGSRQNILYQQQIITNFHNMKGTVSSSKAGSD